MNKKLTVVKNNNTMVNFCESKRIICKSDVKKHKKWAALVTAHYDIYTYII